VVERARGDDRQRQPVLEGDRGRGGNAPVAAGDAERLRAARAGGLAQEFLDPGIRARRQDLGAGKDPGDVLGGVVVVGAGLGIDRDHQPFSLG
jgi:hypothetical protein